jgi:hypothetical protein
VPATEKGHFWGLRVKISARQEYMAKPVNSYPRAAIGADGTNRNWPSYCNLSNRLPEPSCTITDSERCFLSLRKRKLGSHCRKVRLHQLRLRSCQLCLLCSNCSARGGDLRDGVVNEDALLRNIFQCCRQPPAYPASTEPSRQYLSRSLQ